MRTKILVSILLIGLFATIFPGTWNLFRLVFNTDIHDIVRVNVNAHTKEITFDVRFITPGIYELSAEFETPIVGNKIMSIHTEKKITITGKGNPISVSPSTIERSYIDKWPSQNVKEIVLADLKVYAWDLFAKKTIYISSETELSGFYPDGIINRMKLTKSTLN